jgi:hypothetical protein
MFVSKLTNAVSAGTYVHPILRVNMLCSKFSDHREACRSAVADGDGRCGPRRRRRRSFEVPFPPVVNKGAVDFADDASTEDDRRPEVYRQSSLPPVLPPCHSDHGGVPTSNVSCDRTCRAIDSRETNCRYVAFTDGGATQQVPRLPSPLPPPPPPPPSAVRCERPSASVDDVHYQPKLGRCTAAVIIALCFASLVVFFAVWLFDDCRFKDDRRGDVSTSSSAPISSGNDEDDDPTNPSNTDLCCTYYDPFR